MNLDDPPLLTLESPGLESPAKLPRRKLGRGTVALLILLRIYVALAVPMVAYAFIKAVWE
jgi:hypothetical protein